MGCRDEICVGASCMHADCACPDCCAVHDHKIIHGVAVAVWGDIINLIISLHIVV